MTLFLDAKSTTVQFNDAILIPALLAHLSNQGFEPLMSRARGMVSELFGMKDFPIQPPVASTTWTSTGGLLVRRTRRTHDDWMRDDYRTLLGGDIFFSHPGDGMLYLALVAPDIHTLQLRDVDYRMERQLEIGVVGDTTTQSQFDHMIELASEFLASQGLTFSWTRLQHSNAQFEQLQQNEENSFVLAGMLTQSELKLSKELEDAKTREQAIIIRRSGGILANDLTSKRGGSSQEAQAILASLKEAGLISQEYVVICKKTSNQVNRVDSREKIDKMGEMGVLCSCGNSIINERVEVLYAPTPLLQKMLDQSYWMTARLVSLLKEANIPENRILLNLHEGPEEIDAFVDFEGSLLMFELKDSQFSMGHAYPFSGRIGLYKPEYAIIVTTKGIAPEVREYFNKTKPATEIVYVGSLKELEPNLQRMAQQIRSRRAARVLAQFEAIANVEIPLAQIVFDKLSLDTSVLDEQD